MPVLPQLANWAREGLLCDLTELENMHLDAPWYSQYANNAYSVANRLYFTTGDITILNKVNTISLLFNIDYATQLQLPNLYDLVKSGEWTYDKMMEFAKLATADTDGESGMTGEDNWGVLTAYADALSFYGCFGYNICSKTIFLILLSPTLMQPPLSRIFLPIWLPKVRGVAMHRTLNSRFG